MDTERLLITGINGTIGRVIRAPLAPSYEVFGLDVVGPFSDRVFQCDIVEFEPLLEIVRGLEPLPYLVHLAAESDAAATWDQVVGPNIVGTRNVFEVASRIGVKRIVFASSNRVTGAAEPPSSQEKHRAQSESEKITVSDLIQPDGVYGVSKAFGEALAAYYSSRWGMEAVCLRIGTVLARDDPRAAARTMRTWLSHRDLVHLVERSLVAKIRFGIYYGVSDNEGAFWDTTNAREELGYSPQDNASRLRADDE